MTAAAAAGLVSQQQEARAAYGAAAGAGGGGGAGGAEIAYKTFYGAAAPPASYGGVGGTTKDKARYSLNYPSTYPEDTVGKVDKGTKGIDCRFLGPSGEKIFVISLLNEGMDTQGFSLKDSQKALSSLTNSDTSVQDLVLSSKDQKEARRTVDGVEYLDFDITSTSHLLVSICLQEGRVFAIFISIPERIYARNKDAYLKIQESFRSYALPTDRK